MLSEGFRSIEAVPEPFLVKLEGDFRSVFFSTENAEESADFGKAIAREPALS
jgi:hypothetical protein